ncbi:MAG: nucleotide sugar dehydrogenase, partial [Methanoregula sp.]|nr:nucleotide sugar dehydrogenase [Methanoregula sp.]
KNLLDYPKREPSLFVLARIINDFMPAHMLTLTRQGLERTGKSLSEAKIALLGWAFIANSDDARNPPSELYRDFAIEAGATVAVHDPWVESYPGVPIQHDMESVIKNADAVVIFTGHTAYKSLTPSDVKDLCGKDHPVIIDGRNVIDPDIFIQNGFVFKGIGRGDKNNHPM